VDDSDLIRRARLGEAMAQKALFHAHRGRIYQVAFRLTGNAHDAEELTLDTFLAAFQSLGQFDGRAAFSTWCFRIVTNRSLDLLRKRDRRARYHEDLGEAGMDVISDRAAVSDGRLLRAELQGHVEKALGRLSPEIRAAVVLKDIEGLGYAEIAGVLGCAAGTVASRLARGRARIAAYLESVGIDGSYFQPA
jgi:RNA polymerase sigma-70 factor, ECF subfamily